MPGFLGSTVGPVRDGMCLRFCSQLCYEGQMYSPLSLQLPTGPGTGPRNWDTLLNAVARAEVLWLSLGSVAASWDASGGTLLVLSGPLSGAWWVLECVRSGLNSFSVAVKSGFFYFIHLGMSPAIPALNL